MEYVLGFTLALFFCAVASGLGLDREREEHERNERNHENRSFHVIPPVGLMLGRCTRHQPEAASIGQHISAVNENRGRAPSTVLRGGAMMPGP